MLKLLKNGKFFIFFPIMCYFLNSPLTILGQTPAVAENIPVSLSAVNAPLITVLKSIEKQTGLRFNYSGDLDIKRRVTIDQNKKPVSEALKTLFLEKGFSYKFIDKNIFIIKSQAGATDNSSSSRTDSTYLIKGRVNDSKGIAIPGVTVMIRGTAIGTTTNESGEFSLNTQTPQGTLHVSHTGYRAQDMQISAGHTINVVLSEDVNLLEETVVIAYGTTTKKYNTGSIGTIKSAVIEKQPVANAMLTLQGRLAGVVVTQNTGMPGSRVNVQIRGRNSIQSGNEPLYVIDGVPFNSTPINLLSGSEIFYQNPLNSIPPSDIESIDILKDADATAIYGSRGANGVVLVTTKKGKTGKTQLGLNLSAGYGKVSRFLDYMNTKEYVAMRKEAFENDGVAPSDATAYDFLVWDTTRSTDWQRKLIGGTSQYRDAQLSLSGGSQQTTFLFSGNYHYETTVFPGDFSDKRIGARLNVNHSSIDNRFKADISASYSNDNNRLISQDLSFVSSLIPNLPDTHTPDGKLMWYYKGYNFQNPYAYLLKSYSALTDNFISNANLKYSIYNGLSVKANLGFTNTQLKQTSTNPAASQNPDYTVIATADFGNNTIKTWNAEPQIEYVNRLFGGNIEALVGSTFQESVISGNTINASGYNDDGTIGTTTGASNITARTNYSQYRFVSLFGRLKYILNDKYIVNFNGRRDGSTRFGPGKKYGNFASAGLAWLFFNEAFVKDNLSFLSYGKLRGSYGSSGNDKIGDYQYLDLSDGTIYPYGGVSALMPTKIFNSDYAWEVNKKLEFGLELGFLNNAILFNANYFKNKSDNQLINYTLPTQTGFSLVVRNFPAVVKNTGVEFELKTNNVARKDWSWNSSVNLSVINNKLVSFPGIENTSYAAFYTIAETRNRG